MEITRQSSGNAATLSLRGRLDAAWSGSVGDALQQAVRDGFRELRLELINVSFISSAGIRVLLASWKELRRAQGQLAIVSASEEVERILRMAGLASLLHTATAGVPDAAPAPAQAPAQKSRAWNGPSFAGEMEDIAPAARLRGRIAGVAAGFSSPPDLVAGSAQLQPVSFPASVTALGLGAFGSHDTDCAPRLGELLAAGGCAVYLPADGSNQPDYAVTEGQLAPEARMALGLMAEGQFASLARFEAAGEAGVATFSDLANGLLAATDAPQIAFAAVVECAALVGACLRRSPNSPEAGQIFEYPAMRDWLTFTAEPAYQNTVALLTGVLAKTNSGALAAFTRPLGAPSGARAHVHAAAFPFRPVRHGHLTLPETAASLFEAGRVLGVLHLLPDLRPEIGAGESRFYRGAFWFGPVDI